MLIQSNTPQDAFNHAQLTALLLMVLGWGLNWEKSCFIPSQEVTHLGFIFNTKHMTIKCPLDKVARLQTFCKTAMVRKWITVHDCERLLGQMDSVRPSTPLAALHYRSVQRQLLKAKRTIRNPSEIIHLSSKSLSSLKWWVSTS